MSTLSEGGRITEDAVCNEWNRLKKQWRQDEKQDTDNINLVKRVLGDNASELDLFESCQLQKVLEVCQYSRNMAEASRKLFAHTIREKKSINDSDRLRKYLAKFGLSWKGIQN